MGGRVLKRRRVVATTVAVLVVVAVAAGGFVWWQQSHTTDLERAVDTAPADSQRLLWTDWAAIRVDLDADLSDESSADRLTEFLDRGYEADVTSTSALLESAELLHQRFGFSPATIDWELFTQSDAGALVTLHLPDSADFDEIGDSLEELGYVRPDDDDGVWEGGPNLLAQIGSDLTPELQHLALDADDRLVRASDNARFLEQSIDEEDGGPGDGVDQVVEASGEPLSATIYSGDQACRALAMSGAGASDQDQAEQLLAEAGAVNPMTGFALSEQPGGDIRVAMAFENGDQARTNADTRAILARGPAPGQGGDFADRFEVRSVTAEGDVVTMDLEPREGEYVMSDLGSGPVLFATC
jgi:hypothetical protein